MKLLKKTCALSVCLAVVSVFATSGCGKTATPQERVQSALAQLSSEMNEYTRAIDDSIGLEQLKEYMDTNTVQSKVDLSMTLPDNEDVGNVSITLDTISDISNKQFDMDVNVGSYGIDISLGNIIYSDDMLYIKSNKKFDSNVYSIDCTSFVDDFNNSAWSSLLETRLPEASVEVSEISQSIDLDANSSYSLLNDKKNFDLDGKSASCIGVEIIIDKVAAKQVVDLYLDKLEYYIGQVENISEIIEEIKAAEFADDLAIDIYLDSKGRMVNIASSKDIEFTSGSNISFDVDFSGSDRRADVIDGKAYINVGDSIRCLTLSRNASISNQEYLDDIVVTLEDYSYDDVYTVKYVNNWNKEDLTFDIAFSVLDNEEEKQGFYADGYFDDIVKGQSGTFKLNNAKIIQDNENVMIVSCKISVEPTDKTVQAPSGAIDLLGMSENEIKNMIYGVMMNISQIGVN